MARRVGALLPATLLLTILGHAHPGRGEELAFPPDDDSLNGFWRSNGYGYVVRIDGARQQVFHVADGLCLEHPKGEPAFLDFQDRYSVGADGRALRLWSRLDAYPLFLERTESLPEECRQTPADSPGGNLEALVSLFDSHYCFFDLYDVDWPAAADLARSQLSDGADDRTLFELAADLLAPLEDAHIQLDAEIDGQRSIFDANPGKTEKAVAARADRSNVDRETALDEFRRDYWLRDIRDDLLEGSGVMAGNNRIQYGLLPGGVGYMAFASMGGFVDGELGSIAEETGVLATVMDDALGLFLASEVRGVVIDLSLNIGGYDFIAREIAARFTDTTRPVYSQGACDDPHSRRFTHEVSPASGARFTGPVAVLTSDLTVSAAEVLTLSLRALDNVTHVGERTRGAFSTVLTKFLPNGWEVSLSNEVFADHRGAVWEGVGVEPHVAIPVFSPDDPTSGHTAAVRAAAELLRREDVRRDSPEPPARPERALPEGSRSRPSARTD